MRIGILKCGQSPDVLRGAQGGVHARAAVAAVMLGVQPPDIA